MNSNVKMKANQDIGKKLELPYKYFVTKSGILTIIASIVEIKRIFNNESLLNKVLIKQRYLTKP